MYRQTATSTAKALSRPGEFAKFSGPPVKSLIGQGELCFYWRCLIKVDWKRFQIA
jgi:hypothetical protein